MVFVLACLIASASFLVNKLALRYIGIKIVITYSPVLEEMAKTLPAYYLGVDILLTHLGFGLIEAAYDWVTGGSNGRMAALLSIIGHLLFGIITIVFLGLAKNILVALIFPIVIHLAWNTTVIKLGNRKE